MALIKYYHSEMPNAPVLSGTAGALLAVLDACLVTGWGLLTATSASASGGVVTLGFATTHSFEVQAVALVAGAAASAANGEQRVTSMTANSISYAVPGIADGPLAGTITVKLAPAGWVKQFSGANKGAYKSSNPSATGCLLRVDDSGTVNARLRAYDAMTDVDTGTGPTPTDLQVSGGLYLAKSSSASTASRRWAVIASDSFAIVLTAYYQSYVSDYAAYGFGDIYSIKDGDAYRFAVLADSADQTNQMYVGNQSALTSNDSSVGCYIVRSHVGAGGAVQAVLRKPGLLSSSGSNNLPPGPSLLNNALEVCPTLIFEGATVAAPRRGMIPGLYGIPHFVGTGFDSKDRMAAGMGLSGHTLMFFRFQTQSQSSGYRYAVDITGPWD